MGTACRPVAAGVGKTVYRVWAGEVNVMDPLHAANPRQNGRGRWKKRFKGSSIARHLGPDSASLIVESYDASL